MRRSFLLAQALLAGLAASIPLTSPDEDDHLLTRDDRDFDPFDLSYVNNIGAIGDSYSAGIGAGSRMGSVFSIPGTATFEAWKCSRYDKSYPFIVNKMIHGNNQDNFEFYSCSGAQTQDVLDNQIGQLHDNRDAIMISAGGNDAQFSKLLNQCVYQWFTPSKIMVAGLEAARDAGKLNGTLLELILPDKEKMEEYARGCDDQMKFSEGIIKSDEFKGRVEKIIDESKKKLSKDGVIYWTGYAKFFDEDIADDDFCSKPENTWSVFLSKLIGDGLVLQEQSNLTKDLRTKLNGLTELLNQILHDIIVSKAEDDTKVVFINYDRYFGDAEARFCTKGVDKPEKERKEDLAFYPLDIWDPFGSNDFKRGDASLGFVGDNTTEMEYNIMAELANDAGIEYKSDLLPLTKGRLVKGKAKAKAAGGLNKEIPEAEDLPTGELVTRFNMKNSDLTKRQEIEPDLAKRMSILPDGIGRVFHPTVKGHVLIARYLLWNIKEMNVKKRGWKRSPDVEEMGEEACPMPKEPIPQEERPRELKCLGKPFGAPKEESEGTGYSTIKAIREFCKKRANEETGPRSVEGKGEKRIYDRFDITDQGVDKRRSLWLSGMNGHFAVCDAGGKIDQKDCEKVLIGGMQHCDEDKPDTYGMKAQGEGCIEYSIDIGASVHEGDPPWNEHVMGFPPPETVYSYLYPSSGERPIDCVSGTNAGWSRDDAEAAVEQYCNNDLKFGGHEDPFKVIKGNMNISASVDHNITNKEGQPSQFWPTPYESPEWCLPPKFDPMHKNSDDCKYAFKKIIYTRLDTSMACFFTYRCVTYFVSVLAESAFSTSIQIRKDDPKIPPWGGNPPKPPNSKAVLKAEASLKAEGSLKSNITAGEPVANMTGALPGSNMTGTLPESEMTGKPCEGSYAPLFSDCQETLGI